MTSRARVAFTRSIVATSLACALSGCHVETTRVEGLDGSKLPENVRDDYALFAQRCSKCHGLSRPLQSGITSDAYWAGYVERMRRQPASGITPAEAPAILRFLHYYSTVALARRTEPGTSPVNAKTSAPNEPAFDGGAP
jgi:hypothetical protein